MGVKFNILFCLSLLVFSYSVSQVNNRFNYRSNLKQVKFFNQDKGFNNDHHIVFLLPFCANKNDFLINNHIDSLIEKDLTNLDLYRKTQISVDFYLGFLSSLRDLDSLDIKISIFDIQEGEASKNILSNIVDNHYLDSADLIVGPLFTDNFIFLKDIFDKNVPIVSPFSKKPSIVENNEYVFQLPANLPNQLKELSKYIFKNHINDKILLISRDTIFDIQSKVANPLIRDSLVIDTIVPDDIFYSDIILSNIDTANIMLEELKVRSDVIDSIYHKLDTLGMKNVVIIPSNDDVFVTDLLSKLHACRDTNMIVYGMPMLSDFNHVSIYDLMDMKVTFPHNKLFNEREIYDFFIEFSTDHHYIPNFKYSSVGYELGCLFIDAVRNSSFLNYMSNSHSKTVLGTTYFFEKLSKGGYQNNATLILQYEKSGFKIIN